MDEILKTTEAKKELKDLKDNTDDDGGMGLDSQAGCTANVVVVYKNVLYCGNAGDSRCILSNGGKSIEMSYDHKPEDEIERDRITKAGGNPYLLTVIFLRLHH